MMNIEVAVERIRAGGDVINIGGIIHAPAPGPVKFSIENANEVTAERAKTIQELFVTDERLIEGALT